MLTVTSAILGALILQGCSLAADTLTIYPIAHQQVNAAQVDELLGAEAGIELIEASSDPHITPLQALSAGLADITIVENSNPFTSGVRTVLPLFRSVMHILVSRDFDPDAAITSNETLQIHVVNRSHAATTFLELSSQRSKWFGGRYELAEEYVAGETDMIIYVGPINPLNTDWYQDGFVLVSLDQVEDARVEFFREGISYLVPQLEPASIPALTYNLPGNERGLTTLSVDMLLVAKRDTSERAIYDMTRTLIEQKARFAAIAPNIFSWISEDFDPLELSFPLHSGARRYLERDEPGFLERYAESLNFIVYLCFLVLTGLVALARWQARRKKNRVDTFYAKILDIRERAAAEPHEVLITELGELEKEAFALLIAERLAADESFRIFTELLGQVRNELR